MRKLFNRLLVEWNIRHEAYSVMLWLNPLRSSAALICVGFAIGLLA